ncbi:MAG: AAA family ATPase [Phycisphaera sp.]|nr:AAA family ATPase [Phycisphaera sp.]
MRTVVIVNQKGGCGKTTTAINLAGIWASRGKRALLVDLDPQSHCAAGLAIPEQRIDLDISDALVTDAPLDPNRLVWNAGRNLDLIPSRTKLAGLEAARGGLATKPDKEHRLARVVERFKNDYDVCLIDCSPSIGLLTYNALAAATDVLVPVETGFFSLQGALKQAKTIESLQRRLGANAPFYLLATLHEPESVLACDLLQELRRRFGDQVVPTPIRRDLKLKEAVSFGQPAVEYAPESTGARDHSDLAHWLEAKWRPADRPTHPVALNAQPADSYPTGGPELDLELCVSQAPTIREQSNDLGFGQPETKPIPVYTGSSTATAVAATPKSDTMTDANLASLTRPRAGDTRVAEIAALAKRLRDATLHPNSGGTATLTQPTTVVRLEESKPEIEPIGAPSKMKEALGKELLGVRQTPQGVLFVQPIATGRQLAIAGDFNGWSVRANRMVADTRLGVHQTCVHLPPGRHRYRIVVDGRWIADPHNPVIEPNEYGETNSVVVVEPPKGA